MILIKNAKLVVKDNETIIKDILIKDNKIIKIDSNINEDCKVIDANSNLVIPGGIDPHVHLREPGYTHKETILTGTKAAAKGGYTTLMAMPNVVPFPDSVENVKNYLELIKKDAVVNVYPYGCISKEEKGKQVVDINELCKLGIIGFSDDGVGVANDDIMLEAMKLTKTNNSIIVAHTEDMAYRKPGACMHEGKQSKKLNLIGIPSECEYKQIERDIELVKQTNTRYHICHMSAEESVQILREAKANNLKVSGEVTTHHLLLSENDVENTNHKMNPPLRREEDRQSLINGLLDGTIDFIANDHAPHSEEEKNKPMDKAPFGIVAIETSIPLIYTNFVKTGVFTLEQFIKFTSSNAANIFNLNKGLIKEGYDADLVILSDEEEVINKNDFISLGKNTPFDGYKCSGNPLLTICNGKVVFENRKGE